MKSLFLKNLRSYAILIILIIIFFVMSLLSPNFLTNVNILNLIRQVSIIGVISCAMTFVLVGGGFDLSVGSILGLAGTVAGLLALHGINIGISMIVMLVLGFLLGIINGLCVSYFKVNPFVTTLGTMTIYRGLILIITKGYGVRGLPEEFSYLGNKDFYKMPIIGLIFLIVIIVTYFILSRTKLGQYTYAVGGNRECARLSGINVKSIEMATYIITGIAAALAGIMLASRVNTASPSAGVGYELDAIAGCVIGGVRLGGGSGTIMGTVMGILIMGTLTNGMNLLGVSSYVQQLFKGIIIIAAVGFDANFAKNN